MPVEIKKPIIRMPILINTYFELPWNGIFVFPSNDSYKSVNHSGGKYFPIILMLVWLVMNFSRKERFSQPYSNNLRKNKNNKTYTIIKKVLIYNDIRLKILYPTKLIRMPIKKTLLKKEKRHTKNIVVI